MLSPRGAPSLSGPCFIPLPSQASMCTVPPVSEWLMMQAKPWRPGATATSTALTTTLRARVAMWGDRRTVDPANWDRASTAHGCGHRHAVAGGGRGDAIGRLRTVRPRIEGRRYSQLINPRADHRAGSFTRCYGRSMTCQSGGNQGTVFRHSRRGRRGLPFNRRTRSPRCC